MKAASAVLVQSQRQMTVLGLTLPLMIVVSGGAAVSAAIMVVLDLIALLLPAACLSFAGLWLLFLRQMRANPFFDRDLFVGTRFWKGSRVSRHLVAGGRA